jgi:hypothetical protein
MARSMYLSTPITGSQEPGLLSYDNNRVSLALHDNPKNYAVWVDLRVGEQTGWNVGDTCYIVAEFILEWGSPLPPALQADVAHTCFKICRDVPPRISFVAGFIRIVYRSYAVVTNTIGRFGLTLSSISGASHSPRYRQVRERHEVLALPGDVESVTFTAHKTADVPCVWDDEQVHRHIVLGERDSK